MKSPDVGAAIRARRHKRKLSVAAVAAGVGLSRSFIYRLESGDKQVRVRNVLAVCTFLGLSLIVAPIDKPVRRRQP
jgi:transcriptional regulator with XRE-family HTH domain